MSPEIISVITATTHGAGTIFLITHVLYTHLVRKNNRDYPTIAIISYTLIGATITGYTALIILYNDTASRVLYIVIVALWIWITTVIRTAHHQLRDEIKHS